VCVYTYKQSCEIILQIKIMVFYLNIGLLYSIMYFCDATLYFYLPHIVTRSFRNNSNMMKDLLLNVLVPDTPPDTDARYTCHY